MTINKSPSSPSRSLSSCFNTGMKLYDIFPNASFNQVQIANVLGMSLKSSSFKGLLSDLKQYGLIEKTANNEFTITKELKEYSFANEAEKDTIRFGLATRPELFTHIIENQGNHLPDNSTLASILTARFGFTRERASKVAKALRDSLEWANAIDAKGNIIKPALRHPSVAETDVPTETNANTPEAQVKNSEAPFFTTKHNGHSSVAECANDKEVPLILEVPLGRGRKIRIEYPADTTIKEASKASAVLNAAFAE